MRILMVGDIVGSPGRKIFAATVSRMRQAGEVDFVVANGENAAGGRGLTPALADELFRAGADVITLGDHTWDQKEIAAAFPLHPRLIRPANFAPGCPGRGWVTVTTAKGPLTVINLIGRVFMPPMDCPFRCVDEILREHAANSRMIVVDMHAEATSEKIAMGWHLNGRVSAVVGTHTHVQTSDERILPEGTAYLTDLGMTGPRDSVLGREITPIIGKFKTGLPAKFTVASTGPTHLEGLLVTVNAATGKASGARRIRVVEDPAP